MKKSNILFRYRYMMASALLLLALVTASPGQSYAGMANPEDVDTLNTEVASRTTCRHTAKLNGLILIGIINPALEFRISNRWSMQGEVLLSPYFNNCLGTGKPFACALGYVEMRYYVHSPRLPYSGFFFAPVVGGGAYKMNKGIYPLYREQYRNDCYQQGWNMMLGLSLGYKFNLTSRWSLEINWGGGYQHSWYRGFARDSKEEPYHMYIGWNKDAEFLPFFKGGVTAGYRF